MKPIPTKKLNLAYIITTHNRVADAKAQMEIVRNIWEPLFNSIDIYHEYNGSEGDYPQKYLETYLAKHTSLPHYIGAIDLINKGIMHANHNSKTYDYIVVASADTWVFNPHKIIDLFTLITNKNLDILATLWASPIFGTEFFIITPNLAKKVFPLNYQKFVEGNIFNRVINKTPFPLVECYFSRRVFRHTNLSLIGLIPYRKVFIPFFNRHNTEDFYSSHHDQIQRKKALEKQLKTFLGSNVASFPTLHGFIGD